MVYVGANVSEEAHKALRVEAAKNGKALHEFIREVLENYARNVKGNEHTGSP